MVVILVSKDLAEGISNGCISGDGSVGSRPSGCDAHRRVFMERPEFVGSEGASSKDGLGAWRQISKCSGWRLGWPPGEGSVESVLGGDYAIDHFVIQMAI